jgi:hypothetical protein
VNDIAQKLKSNLGAYQLEYVWDGTKVRPYGRAGLEAAFRLSSAVALTVEGNANILSDKYNSKKAGNADWYFNALAGVKINLGKAYTTRFIPAPEPEVRYVEKVVEKIVEVLPDNFVFWNSSTAWDPPIALYYR